MADYDLGSARGRIVIDEDTRGASSAAKSMSALALEAKSLERAFRSAEGPMTKMEGNLRATAESLTRAQRAAAAFQNALDRTATSVTNVAGQIAGLNTATNTLERTMARAIRTAMDLKSALADYSSVGSIITKVVGSFIGLEKTFDSMPNWVRQTRNITAGIVGFGAVANRVVPRVGAGFRAAAVALGLMSPQLASVRAALAPIGALFGGAAARVGGFSNGIIQAARGVGQMVLGAALLKNAFTGIMQAAKIATIGLSGLSLAAAGMKAVGTVALGVANAVKQMSGAFLLVPGVLLGVGIAGGVAKLAFKGIGDAMKAAFGPADKFNDAVKDLSPTMQAVARSVQNVAPEFKKMQESVSAIALAGFSDDIAKLSKQYLPTLNSGVNNVARGLNSAKNGFRDFLAQPATVRDLGAAFGSTSTIIQNMSRAIWPVSAALRDIAVVGLEVFAELTGGIGTAGAKFGQFIAEARRAGELKAWIKDGIQGFRDLGSTLANTGKAFRTIFEAFGANGDNALERLANSAEKFSNSMTKSASNGGLKTVADALQRMSSISMDVLESAMSSLLDVMQRLAPFAEAMSTAFGGTLLAAMKAISVVASAVAEALGNLEGLGSVLGVILGLGAAFKVMQIAMLPIIRTATAVAGAMSLVRGASNSMAGVSAAMASAGAGARVAGVQMGAFGSAVAGVGRSLPVVAQMQRSFVTAATAATHFGRTAGTVAAGVTGLRAAGSSLLSLIGGPWVAAIAAAVAVGYSFVAQNRTLAELQGTLADRADRASKSIKGFTAAFSEANGIMGKGIVKEATAQFDKLGQKLEETSKKGSGVMSDIGAYFKDSFSLEGLKHAFDTTDDGFVKLNNRANSALDHIGQEAGRAKASIDELGLSSDQLGAAVTGTDQEFQNLVNSLRATAGGGKEAIAEVQILRDSFTHTKAAMDAVGPGAIALGNAIDVIADKSSTASEKLEAMKSALEAMGLLQVSAVEAMANVSEAIEQIDTALQTPIGNADQLGTALLNATGGLNAMNPAAQELWNRVKPLSESLRQVASVGGDVHGAFNQMQPALESLRQSAGLSEVQWQNLIRTLGLTPTELTTLYQLTGSNEATQELVALAAKLNEVPNNKTVKVEMSDPMLIEKLKQIGVQVTNIDSATGTVDINVPTDKVRSELNGLFTLVRDGATGQLTLSSNVPTQKQQTQDLLSTINGVNGLAPNFQIGSNVPQVKAEVSGLTTAMLGLSNLPPIAAPPVEAPVAPPTEPAPAQLPLPAPTVEAPKSPPVEPPPAQLPLPAPPVDKPVVPTPDPPAVAPIAAPIVDKPVIPVPDMPVLPTIPSPPPVIITADGGPAIAAIESVNGALGAAAGRWNEFAAAVAAALNAAIGSINTFVSSAQSALAGASSGASASGAALGQGFADGIASKEGAVRAAALKLAEAAAAPLPRSPAKIGPFSGTGWTPYRGKSLALGFAEGIEDNIGPAQAASMDMATAVATAMDSIRSTFGMVGTSFAANRTPGASGSKYFRDPEKSDADIAAARAEKAKAKAETEAEDARFKESDDRKKAEKEAAEATKTGTKANKEAIGSMQELADKFDLTITSNKRDEPGSFHNDGSAFDFGGSQENLAKLNAYLAKNDPGARELFYDPGTNIDEGKKTGAIGGHSDHVHYVPSDTSKSTERATEEIVDNTAKTSKSQEDIIDELRNGSGYLSDQIRIAENPASSDPDVIRALQAIDDEIATTGDREIHDGLEGVRDAVMDDRGIKKYDPNEGASTDAFGDSIKLAQAVVGLFDTIKSGLTGATETMDLLIRGISNTKELNTAIDGFQSMASTVGEVVSTIASIAQTAATLAALASFAIPGVGQIAAVAAVVTGGIGAANAIVDIVQEVMSIGGMFLGGFLSMIAGGSGGALSGNITTLLDTNDNTIKTWSDADPGDKRVHRLPGGGGNGGTVNNGINQLQIYQGPGQSTDSVLRDTMFYVRSSQVGAYAG